MIYFDNSATTKIDSSVLDTYNKVSKAYFGNPSSLHDLGETTTGLLTQSRKLIANLIGVKEGEIYFTSGGTEGDNWVIKGTAFEKAAYGKHLITSEIEHPAVKESIKQLQRMGWEVTYLPVDKNGVVSVKELKAALREETVLVSVMAVNNETGSIQPIDAIGTVLKDTHVNARNNIWEIGHPDIENLRVIGSPLQHMSRTPSKSGIHPPKLGEHTFEIMKNVLGMSQIEIDELVSSKVIQGME